MPTSLKNTATFGLILVAAVLVTACSRDASPNAPVSDAGNADAANTTTPSADSTTPGTSSTPNTDMTTAFPLVEPPKQDVSAASTSTVPIQLVDAEEFQAVVEKHRGKVVLVDCWATWCGPCKEQFPHTVQLSRQLADQGLAVISMSFDDPERQQDVAAFLEKQSASFEHLISKLGASVESFVKFEIEGGALPYYKLYDRSGKLRYQFCGDNTGLENVLKVEELDKRIEELLAEKA